MKKRHENIKNELAYFYKVIKNMAIKDNIKRSKINECEMPLDEILYNQFCVSENLDKHLEEQNLLGWIELIENQKLYEAINRISIEEQIFINYIVKEGRTQRELSRTYGVAQKNISKRFNRGIEKIRYLFD